MKLRYAFVGLLLMALALTVAVQGQMATTRRHYQFQIVDQFSKTVTDSCTMVVYVAGGAAETVYSSRQGAAIGSNLTAQTDGLFDFWTDETSVDIQITNNVSGGVMKASSLTVTDHLIMMSTSLYVAASGLTTTTITATGTITGVAANWTGDHNFGVDKTGVDVTFYGDTTTNYILWDGSADTLYLFDADVHLDDESNLIFGTGTDFWIECDTANTLEFLATNTDEQGAVVLGSDEEGVDLKAYAATTGDFMLWDASDENLEFVEAGIMFDQTNVDYTWAAASDAFSLTATDHSSAAYTIGSVVTTNGLDLIWQHHTTGDTVKFDAGAAQGICTFTDVDLQLDDDATLRLGSDAGGDFTLAGTSNTLTVTPKVAGNDIKFGATAGTLCPDIYWYADGTGTYVMFDEELQKVVWEGVDLHVNDTDILSFGDDTDFKMVGTDNTLTITPLVAGDDIKFGATAGTYCPDIYWYADGTGTYVMFDEENQKVTWEGVDLFMMDDDYISFGDVSDFTMRSVTAKTLDILPLADTDDYAVNIGVDESGVDVNFFGTTASDGLFWDGGADSLTVTHDFTLFTCAEAAANQFKVDATGTHAGNNVINLETTDGGILFNADGAANGDITLESADDVILTVASVVAVTTSGAEADQFKVDATGTHAGNVINLETTDGGILLNADGATNGDITIDARGTITTYGHVTQDGRVTENHSTSHTLTSPTDIGTLITVDTAAVVITLPAVGAGAQYTVMNIGADGTEIHVDVNANDLIAGGCGFAAALDDGDKLTNTGATANKGDYVKLGYFDATGWYIIEMVGIWADGG